MDLGFFRSLSGSPVDTPGGQQESRRRGRQPFLLIILALAVIVSSGCGGLVMPFTKTESYASSDSLVLKQQRSDVLEAVSEVGKAMGFSVSSLDRARKSISLEIPTTTGSAVLIGKWNQATLTALYDEDARTIDLKVSVIGNFGAGGQDSGEKLLADFKQRLAGRLGSR